MGDADARERHRIFVAIRIPDQIKVAMAAAQAELRHVLPERAVNWTKPEQLHLTLKFLGNVEVQRVDTLMQQLGGACNGFSPLRLGAERVGAFTDLRFPQVIWVGSKDDTGQLTQLQGAVEAASGEFTSQPAEERFSGHVTLGRAKRLKRREAQILSGWLSRMADRSFGEWTANEIDLMRSELSSEGARHTSIGRLPFKGLTTTGLDE